jgi:hypothetical protein
MSQSDYIKLLKTTTMVGEIKQMPSVLEPEDYTAFESYNLETTVSNTKNSYSRLQPTGYKKIFGMEKKVSTCPTFTLCTSTNTRTNRVLNSPQIPVPTERKTKIYTPLRCQFTKSKSYVVRSAICSKRICKCGTHILSATS